PPLIPLPPGTADPFEVLSGDHGVVQVLPRGLVGQLKAGDPGCADYPAKVDTIGTSFALDGHSKKALSRPRSRIEGQKQAVAWPQLQARTLGLAAGRDRHFRTDAVLAADV